MTTNHPAFPIEPSGPGPLDEHDGTQRCPPVSEPMPVDPYIQALPPQLQEDFHALWALLLMLLPGVPDTCRKIWRITVQYRIAIFNDMQR